MERAFIAFIKGGYVEPPDFAYKTYWKSFQDFSHHTDRLSERRWHLILEFEAEATGSDLDVDELMISAYRGKLYIPSSPAKA